MTIFRKGLFEADTIPSSDVAQAGEWCAVSPLIHKLGSLFLPWLRRAHSIQFPQLSPSYTLNLLNFKEEEDGFPLKVP